MTMFQYVKSIDANTNTITNTLTETTSVSFEKRWIGGASPRPDIEVKLLANGQVASHVDGSPVVNIKLADGTLKGEFTNLPTFDFAGKAISYSVEEVIVPTGYTVSYDGFVITNTYAIGKTQISATKDWVGGPEEKPRVQFQLYRVAVDGAGAEIGNSEVVGPAKVLSNGTTKVVDWTDLDSHNNNGLKYKYYVEEVEVPTNYNKSATTYDANGNATIVNTYVEGITSHTVHKNWVGGPITRPEVKVAIFRNGTQMQDSDLADGQTAIVTLTSSGIHTWKKLQASDKDGKPYTYEAKEISVAGIDVDQESKAGDYSVSYSNGIGTDGNSTVITNTYIKATYTLYAEKAWVGGDATNRPAVKFQLLQNGKAYGQVQVLLNDKTSWADLPVTDEFGQRYNYSVEEIPVEAYIASKVIGDGSQTSPFKITNTYVGLTQVEIEKVWVDNDNATGVRPTKITFEAIQKKNGIETGKVFDKIFDVKATGTYIIDGLPASDIDGTDFTYDVSEVVPVGYEMQVEGRKITNTLTGEVEIPVEKVWLGGNPTNRQYVIVTLKADGTEQQLTLTLNEANGWKDSFTKLPAFNRDGKAIVYEVDEKDIPGYAKEVRKVGNVWIITNTYGSGLKSITATKEWVGGPAVKPTIHIQLYRQVAGGNKEYVGSPITLTNGTTTNTWDNLPSHNNNGQEYIYTVDEVEVPENYVKSAIVYDADGNATITNTYKEGVTSHTVNKNWIGGPKDKPNVEVTLYRQITGGTKEKVDITMVSGITNPANLVNNTYTWSNLPKTDNKGNDYTYTVEETPVDGYGTLYSNIIGTNGGSTTITNTYASEKTTIHAQKAWTNGQEPRPEVKFHLISNGEIVPNSEQVVDPTSGVSWTVDKTDEYGQDYIYKVDEVSVPENYTKVSITGTGTQSDSFIITNDYTPGVTSHTVNKVWVNGQSPRPDVEMVLYRTIEGGSKEQVTSTMVTGIQNPISLSEYSQTQTYTWSGLPTTDKATGKAITYHVEELTVGGTSVDRTSMTVGNYTVKEETVDTKTTVTNTYASAKTDITATKTWVGGPAQHPTVNLELLRDGSKVSGINPIELTNGNIQAIWKDLDKTDSTGKEYIYTVRELVDDGNGNLVEKAPVGYEVSYNGLQVTNTYVGSTKVEVTKTWVDNSNSGSTRPSQITLIAIRNDGQRFEKVFDVVTTEDSTKYTFENLPEFDSEGKAYTYTVDEVTVAGYEKSISADGKTITNTLTGTIDIPFTKKWIGGDSANRPEIKINLMNGGTVVESKTLANGGDYTGVFADKPSVDTKGAPITYTIAEDPVTGYTSAIEKVGDTWIITNTYDQSDSIKVDKVWVDKDGKEFTPSDLKAVVLLNRNGQNFRAVELDSTNNWTYTFENLEEFDSSGNNYTYTVEEIPVAGYTSTKVTNADGSITITNTEITPPPTTIDIPVVKLWDGGAPSDISSITLNVTRSVNEIVDSTFERTVTLTSESDWRTTITGLPKTDTDGNEYKYEVLESPISGYQAQYEGGFKCGVVIYNKPTTGSSLEITKVDSKDSSKLLAGAEFELRGVTNPNFSMKLVSKVDGKITFTSLPYGEYELKETKAPENYKTGDTVRIVSVTRDGEVKVDGVAVPAEGLVITNIMIDSKTQIIVHKTWVNLPDGDEVDNHTAEFTLYANGVEVKDELGNILTRSIKGNGNQIFENILMNDNKGNAIIYTVEETLIDGKNPELSGFKTIKAGSAETGFVFTNIPEDKFGVVLQKIDGDTKQVLQGGKFELWGNLDETIDSIPVSLVLEDGVMLENPMIITLLEDGIKTTETLELTNSIRERSFTITPADKKTYSIDVPEVPGYNITVTADKAIGFTIRVSQAVAGASTPVAPIASPVEHTLDNKLLESLTNNITNMITGYRQSFTSAMTSMISFIKERVLGIDTEVDLARQDLQAITEKLAPEDVATVQDEINSINSRLDKIEAMLGEVESSQTVYEQIMAEADGKLDAELDNTSIESKESVESMEEPVLEEAQTGVEEAQVLEIPQGSVDNTVVLSFGDERFSFGINLFAVSDPIANVGYEQIGTYTTDEYGLIIVGDLPKGEYYFVEVQAPDGYKGTGEKIVFNVPDVDVPSKPIVKTVTNEKSSVDILVRKEWSGDDEAKRPKSIQITLSDGKTATLSGPNWTHTFENLPYKDDSGNVINYTVTEDQVPKGYKVVYEKVGNELIVINIAQKDCPDCPIPEIPDNPDSQLINIPVVKKWDDGNYKYRPSSVTIRLIENGKVTDKTLVLSEVNDWFGIFKDLDKTKTYTIQEDTIGDKYTTSIKGSPTDGFVITNSRPVEPSPQPEYTKISGQKIWLGDTELDRPDSIEVKLINETTGEVKTKLVRSSDGWKYDFGQVILKDVNGLTYSYRIVEVVPEGYRASYEGYDIVNTKVPDLPPVTPEEPEFMTISGQKTWIGDNEGDRPDHIYVKLINITTSKVEMTMLVNRAMEWKYVFDEVVSKDINGVRYSYRIEEVVPEGYTATYNGYDITNTKIPDLPPVPIVPVEPVPPTPEKPVVPVDPVDPTPGKPENPIDPTPGKPVDLVDSTSDKPVEPTPSQEKPIKPVKPIDPVETNPKTLVKGYAGHIAAMVITGFMAVLADFKRRKKK